MQFQKLMLAAAIAGTFGLTACSEGDNSTLTIEGDTTTINNGDDGSGSDGGSDSTISQNCPDWSSAKNVDADGNDVCLLPAAIMVDRTLTSDIVWLMNGRTTVGNGNQEMSATDGLLADEETEVTAVTLTIEAGTQIKGETGTFANLLITRGSTIMAEGTADAPIIFSSDDDGYEGSGEWGGLIIQGYGSHNACTVPEDDCNVDAEGESGFAGGHDPADSSGMLSYVILTEGGYEFAPGDEINGISLVAVGSGTTLDHIQVNANSDDGIEFFGGAVNAKYLVLTGNQDDSIDWDEGFQGNIQFAIVKQSETDGDKVVEADTFGSDAFLSMPTVANVTYIGAGTATTMMSLKEGTGGYFFNSVMLAEGSQLETCVTVTDDAAPNIADMTLVFHNIIADCPAFGNDDLAADGTVYLTAADLDDNYASQAAEATIEAPIDWAEVIATYASSTADVDFLEPTSYLGAVNPDGSDAWFEGWILDGTL